jgi:RHS repeat-associated protein
VPSTTNSSLIDHFTADIATAQDYYPFGMLMAGRTFTASIATNYRYGFNGKENDNEVKGVGNEIDYGMRVYDSRAGRIMSVDPLTEKYPWLSPFQYAGNKPVWQVDVDGMEATEEAPPEEPPREEVEKDDLLTRLARALHEESPTEKEDRIKKFEKLSKKTPQERAKAALDALKNSYRNINNGLKNYSQNALLGAQLAFGGPLLNSDPEWQVHEENVYNDLAKNNPQGQFGKQVTLDVYNKNGQMETIRVDILFKPNAKSSLYELVDAKFSSVRDVTNSKLESMDTESQGNAYNWIKNNQVSSIIPRGENAINAGLPVGQSIQVSPLVKIAVNIPQNPQNQSIYGMTGILYRNY